MTLFCTPRAGRRTRQESDWKSPEYGSTLEVESRLIATTVRRPPVYTRWETCWDQRWLQSRCSRAGQPHATRWALSLELRWTDSRARPFMVFRKFPESASPRNKRRRLPFRTASDAATWL